MDKKRKTKKSNNITIILNFYKLWAKEIKNSIVLAVVPVIKLTLLLSVIPVLPISKS